MYFAIFLRKEDKKRLISLKKTFFSTFNAIIFVLKYKFKVIISSSQN